MRICSREFPRTRTRGPWSEVLRSCATCGIARERDTLDMLSALAVVRGHASLGRILDYAADGEIPAVCGECAGDFVVRISDDAVVLEGNADETEVTTTAVDVPDEDPRSWVPALAHRAGHAAVGERLARLGGDTHCPDCGCAFPLMARSCCVSCSDRIMLAGSIHVHADRHAARRSERRHHLAQPSDSALRDSPGGWAALPLNASD